MLMKEECKYMEMPHAGQKVLAFKIPTAIFNCCPKSLSTKEMTEMPVKESSGAIHLGTRKPLFRHVGGKWKQHVINTENEVGHCVKHRLF